MRAEIDRRAMVALSSGHLATDFASGAVPALVPFLVERYDLTYTIGFDASGHIYRQYKVFGLPTQFFIRPDGVIDSVGKTVDEARAVAAIEAILPAR